MAVLCAGLVLTAPSAVVWTVVVEWIEEEVCEKEVHNPAQGSKQESAKRHAPCSPPMLLWGLLCIERSEWWWWFPLFWVVAERENSARGLNRPSSPSGKKKEEKSRRHRVANQSAAIAAAGRSLPRPSVAPLFSPPPPLFSLFTSLAGFAEFKCHIFDESGVLFSPFSLRFSARCAFPVLTIRCLEIRLWKHTHTPYGGGVAGCFFWHK